MQGMQKQTTQQRMLVSEALKIAEETEMEKLLDDEKVAQEVRRLCIDPSLSQKGVVSMD